MYKNKFWYIIFAIDKCSLELIFVEHICPFSANGVDLASVYILFRGELFEISCNV